MATKRATLVIIGGVLDYHEVCAKAREQGIFVERLYGSVAPRKLVAASKANWSASFAEWLAKTGVTDWRLSGGERAAIRFKSGISGAGCALLFRWFGSPLLNGIKTACVFVPADHCHLRHT
jgi:hypothetical protein